MSTYDVMYTSIKVLYTAITIFMCQAAIFKYPKFP